MAYGASNSGCGSGWSVGLTDTTSVTSGTNQAYSGPGSLTPCLTMENMASTMGTFYSDYEQSGSNSTCQDSGHSTVEELIARALQHLAAQGLPGLAGKP